MSHANFGACITFATIHPKNAYCNQCYNLPQGKCYSMPQRHIAHEMCNCRKTRCILHLATYIQYSVCTHNNEHVYIHNIYSTIGLNSTTGLTGMYEESFKNKKCLALGKFMFIHLILHVTSLNVLLSILSSCGHICTSGFRCRAPVTTCTCYN